MPPETQNSAQVAETSPDVPTQRKVPNPKICNTGYDTNNDDNSRHDHLGAPEYVSRRFGQNHPCHGMNLHKDQTIVTAVC